MRDRRQRNRAASRAAEDGVTACFLTFHSPASCPAFFAFRVGNALAAGRVFSLGAGANRIASVVSSFLFPACVAASRPLPRDFLSFWAFSSCV